jgi:hypothetical protein
VNERGIISHEDEEFARNTKQKRSSRRERANESMCFASRKIESPGEQMTNETCSDLKLLWFRILDVKQEKEEEKHGRRMH